jgi:transcriptional regulator with XRE-family HTH domain
MYVRAGHWSTTREVCAVKVHNLKGLRTLMVVQGVSQRQLAVAAGYRSHAYMGRILRGEVETLDPDAAHNIARFLEVDLDFVFAPQTSSVTAHSALRHPQSSAHPGRTATRTVLVASTRKGAT